MTKTLHVCVEGEPSTAHRPRYSGCSKSGRPIMRSDESFRAWKTACRNAALVARVAWERDHHEPWPTEARYAVSCLGRLRQDRKDADSIGRAFLDGAQGVLWRNDRSCKPVILDTEIDKERPRLVVTVIAWDPDEEWVEGIFRVRK